MNVTHLQGKCVPLSVPRSGTISRQLSPRLGVDQKSGRRSLQCLSRDSTPGGVQQSGKRTTGFHVSFYQISSCGRQERHRVRAEIRGKVRSVGAQKKYFIYLIFRRLACQQLGLRATRLKRIEGKICFLCQRLFHCVERVDCIWDWSDAGLLSALKFSL